MALALLRSEAVLRFGLLLPDVAGGSCPGSVVCAVKLCDGSDVIGSDDSSRMSLVAPALAL